MRDDALLEELIDLFSNDKRTSDLELSMNVDGGVAHVSGTVRSEDEKQLLRRILRRQNGLYAVWDLLSLPDEELSILDIGCGVKKQFSQAIGIDRIDYPGIDVITDLEERLPFDDGSNDHVFAINILEHIRDL